MRLSGFAFLIAILAGCAPRQDPGVPLPPPTSGTTAVIGADVAVALSGNGVTTIPTDCTR